jgi:hypothetical protein
MDINPLIVIAIAITAIILAIYALGMYVKRKLLITSPESKYVKKVSWIEAIMAVFLITYALICVSIYQLAPHNVVGSFLHTWYGWLVALVIWYFLSVVIMGVIEVAKHYTQKSGRSGA